MPGVILTFKNETPNSLTYTETSPQDPQVVTVAGHSSSPPLRIDEPVTGGIHVIVCNGFIKDGTQVCSPGSNNVVDFTVNPTGVVILPMNGPGDSFTAKVTNKTLAPIYCVLAGPGSHTTHGPVLTTDVEKAFSIPATGAVKYVFCESFFGEETFHFVDPVEKITVIAEIENGTPTVQFAPTPP